MPFVNKLMQLMTVDKVNKHQFDSYHLLCAKKLATNLNLQDKCLSNIDIKNDMGDTKLNSSPKKRIILLNG